MNLLAELVFVRPDLSFGALLPVALLGVLMVATLLLELKPAEDSRRPISVVFASIGLFGLIAYLLNSSNEFVGNSFNGMLANDSFSRSAVVLIAGCALLAILSGQEELQSYKNRNHGEFVALILGASIGMVLMSSALNTILLFLGLELFSIALYLLCIFFPERTSSQESGMKYFLLSSAASAVLLYGLAMLYGATGTTWIVEMGARPELLESPLALLGAVMVICGLLFKLAAVPFQFWAPDVYQGAPTTVTAFMSVATKVAAMVALWRLFVDIPELGGRINFILMACSLLSMLIGNVLALSQSNVKRMLALSGVGNAGYLLIAPLVGIEMEGPVLFFLTTYLFANMGAFLAVAKVEQILLRDVTRADLRGLSRSHPALAAVFALSLVSLAGLPPAGGFLAKFYLFGQAVASPFAILPAIGIVCSLIGAAYYLGTAITLFDSKDATEFDGLVAVTSIEDEPPTSTTSIALVICAAGILILGVMPGPVMSWLSGGSL